MKKKVLSLALALALCLSLSIPALVTEVTLSSEVNSATITFSEVVSQGTVATKDGKVLCPICGRPTRQHIRTDTAAENLPVWCPNCRKESIVNIERLSQSQRRESTSASA